MTKQERARLLHREGMNYSEIGRLLGLPRTTIYYWIVPTRGKSGNVRDATRVPRLNVVAAPTVTPEALKDRERRYSLLPRDITAAFCGDPLPGYSALDRKSA